jgi:hypothetical protein
MVSVSLREPLRRLQESTGCLTIQNRSKQRSPRGSCRHPVPVDGTTRELGSRRGLNDVRIDLGGQ